MVSLLSLIMLFGTISATNYAQSNAHIIGTALTYDYCRGRGTCDDLGKGGGQSKMGNLWTLGFPNSTLCATCMGVYKYPQNKKNPWTGHVCKRIEHSINEFLANVTLLTTCVKSVKVKSGEPCPLPPLFLKLATMVMAVISCN